jgi:hypothetical protein
MGTFRKRRRVEVNALLPLSPSEAVLGGYLCPCWLTWGGRILRFAGGAEYSFSGEATLSSDTHRKAWSRPPIGMEFSIVMFTSSGLLVRYLKVIEKSGYRYIPRDLLADGLVLEKPELM